jgi:small subunit ribosomal protein S4
VKVGDVVTLAESEKNNVRIQRAIAGQIGRGMPAWLELSGPVADALSRSKDFPVDLKDNKVEGTMKVQPTRDELSYPVNEQYIVELYSK